MALPTTLPDAIKMQEERIINYRILNKYTKMHNIETDDNLIIPIDSIVNKYRNFLEDSVKTTEMTDEEWFTYIPGIDLFEFAYAITTYSSQGSEWNKVICFDERIGDKEMQTKLLFTAVTRARESVTIVLP